MRVTIPENISEITLGQYQELTSFLQREDVSEQEAQEKTIEIFTGIPKDHVSFIEKNEVDELLKDIATAMNKEVPFQKFFVLNSVEYGFTPNLDAIAMNEWVDICQYNTGVENYHRLMAILFRKVVLKDKFGNYKIEVYEGTGERAELFKQMPMNIVNGALLFFSSLATDLKKHIQKSIIRELAKDKEQLTTLRSGVGTQQ